MQAKQSETEKLMLWRERRLIAKFHNFVIYIQKSFCRKNLFNNYQQENISIMDNDKIYSLIWDRRVHWNLTYLMINCAIQLWDYMDQYYYILRRSTEKVDHSIILDIFSSNDWNVLIEIKAILKLYHSVIKHLEVDIVDNTYSAL